MGDPVFRKHLLHFQPRGGEQVPEGVLVLVTIEPATPSPPRLVRGLVPDPLAVSTEASDRENDSRASSVRASGSFLGGISPAHLSEDLHPR